MHLGRQPEGDAADAGEGEDGRELEAGRGREGLGAHEAEGDPEHDARAALRKGALRARGRRRERPTRLQLLPALAPARRPAARGPARAAPPRRVASPQMLRTSSSSPK